MNFQIEVTTTYAVGTVTVKRFNGPKAPEKAADYYERMAARHDVKKVEQN